jgi:hypothetical protein
MGRAPGVAAPRFTAILLVGAVAPLIGFALLAEEANERERLEWAMRIGSLFERLPGAGRDAGAFADVGAVAAVAAAIIVPFVLLRRGRIRAAAFWALAIGGLALADPFLSFALVRPPGVSPHGADSALGGSGLVVPTAAALALVAIGADGRGRLRVGLVAVIFTVVYGLFLVYAHWYDPSAVVAGWCVAVAWLTGTWLLFFGRATVVAQPAPPVRHGRGSTLAVRIRKHLTRRPLDDPLDWFRFRLDTFPRRVGWLSWLPLPEIQAATYHDLPWVGLRSARRTEATRTRWERMLPLVRTCGVNTAVDVGGSVGWFAFALARAGIPCVNVERDARNVRIGLYARKRAAASDASFLVMDLDPPRAATLPDADCYLFLSVWHHFVREYGFEEATRMLREFWSKTAKVMFFETGSAEMPASWRLPVMTPNPRVWVTRYLQEACAESLVLHLDEHRALGPNNEPCARDLFAIVRTDGSDRSEPIVPLATARPALEPTTDDRSDEEEGSRSSF